MMKTGTVFKDRSVKSQHKHHGIAQMAEVSYHLKTSHESGGLDFLREAVVVKLQGRMFMCHHGIPVVSFLMNSTV